MKEFIVRTESEINKQLDLAYKTQLNSVYHNMTYEQGMIAMYEWLIGDTDDLPMDED